jgi:hypothetical protein
MVKEPVPELFKQYYRIPDPMHVISHRGFWSIPDEKNTLAAFERSFASDFGTETDFRDLNGELVISHDPARSGAPTAAELLGLLARMNPLLPLAINIKADGLQRLLSAGLQSAGIENYFLFDMSVPDAIQSLKAGLRVYTRHSDIEPVPVLYAESAGVWLDAFFDTGWITPARINEHLGRGKPVCLVSPELHGHGHLGLWRQLAESTLSDSTLLTLCTDLPSQARQFFEK